ncbi:hypothetical protein [Nesterenkonia cremea]|nr:hypothetical protein [Nesterenkonia cremea]
MNPTTYGSDVPGDRSLYQLIRTGEEWKIAVLTRWTHERTSCHHRSR